MSNASILKQLGAELDAYEREERSTAAFCDTLYACIEAMEALPYDRVTQMRHFYYELEVAGFHEDEGRFADRASVVGRLRAWLQTFEEERA